MCFHHPATDRHPMHQFVVDHMGYELATLLYRYQYAATEQAAVFHVTGPAEPYERVLSEHETVQERELLAW